MPALILKKILRVRTLIHPFQTDTVPSNYNSFLLAQPNSFNKKNIYILIFDLSSDIQTIVRDAAYFLLGPRVRRA